MNRLKKNNSLTIVYISIILIVIGSAVAAFLSWLDFPREWFQWGLFMGIVGAAGLGVGVALYVHSIPQQERFYRKRLEVKAWKDLGTNCYGVIVAAISIYMLIQKGDGHKNFAMIIAAVIIGIWIPVGQLVMKKRNLQGLDERERLIHERAKAISDSFFASFCMMGLLGLWGWIGLKSTGPVYVPVIMVFGLVAIAEILKPLLILIQCKMEQADNCIEGESM